MVMKLESLRRNFTGRSFIFLSSFPILCGLLSSCSGYQGNESVNPSGALKVNGEGIGGGGDLAEKMLGVRRVVADVFTLIERNPSLVDSATCFDGHSSCGILTKISLSQKKQLKDFFLAYARKLKQDGSETGIPVRLTENLLEASDSDHGHVNREMIALRLEHREIQVHFESALIRANTARPIDFVRTMVRDLSHEFGHLAGNEIPDAEPFGAFNKINGGFDFLQSLGAIVSAIATSSGRLNVHFGIKNDCEGQYVVSTPDESISLFLARTVNTDLVSGFLTVPGKPSTRVEGYCRSGKIDLREYLAGGQVRDFSGLFSTLVAGVDFSGYFTVAGKRFPFSASR